jgi:hypothetical protein
MANVKISQLPAASQVTSDDLFAIVDSGSLTTQRATAEQILHYVTGSTFNTLVVTDLTASNISSSNYIGLPSSELVKLNISSSVSLSTTQRAIFANNSESSSISITLPSSSLADSREYYVIKADAVSGTVTVLPSMPDLINGASSFDLNGPFQSITLIHDGTGWYVF